MMRGYCRYNLEFGVIDILLISYGFYSDCLTIFLFKDCKFENCKEFVFLSTQFGECQNIANSNFLI